MAISEMLSLVYIPPSRTEKQKKERKEGVSKTRTRARPLPPPSDGLGTVRGVD
jgi:hypothetical protein